MGKISQKTERESRGFLETKTAIITGGGTGIGKAIAKRFHDEGAQVVFCGRRENKLKEAVSTIAPNGDRVYSIRADVTVESDIKRLVELAVEKTGRIDILVNNAGVMRFGRLDEIDPSLWDLHMRTNSWGPWRLMVAVLPELRKVGGGSIVNITSIAGDKAFPGVGLYGASKASLQKLSQVMAMEVASDNIRVNLISPALVEDTELSIPIIGDDEEKIAAFYKKIRPLHPLGRGGKVEDIADAAIFLASEQSSFITGIILEVDGGRHMASNRPAD